jgi:hypothetical protein
MKIEERFTPLDANIVPALREVVLMKGLKSENLSVGLPVQGGRWAGLDRQRIQFSDGEKSAEWQVNSLRELYRGETQPPPHLDRFPPEYVPLFAFIEQHVRMFCDKLGDKSDQEFEEVYSSLHRRPDGRSLGPLHDFLWQVCAVMLATRVVSGAEFEGLMGALHASVRRWAARPISRNYIGYLKGSFGH